MFFVVFVISLLPLILFKLMYRRLLGRAGSHISLSIQYNIIIYFQRRTKITLQFGSNIGMIRNGVGRRIIEEYKID